VLRLKKSTLVLGVVLFIQLVVILVALSHPLVLTSSHMNKFEDYEDYYSNVKAELEADISRQLSRIEETYEGLPPELAESFNRLSVGTSTDLGPRFDSGSQMFSTFNGLPLSIQFAAMISLISFIPTLTGIAALSKKRLVKGKINKILLIAIFAMTFVCIAVFAQMNAQVLLSSFGEIGLAAEVPTPHPGAPTYTIWTDGIYTYAMDASGNVTEWSPDTDASAVINNAISSTSGGKIFIKSGTYYISDNIDDNGKSNIELCGEGAATVLKFAANRNSMYEAGIWLGGSEGSEITNWYVHDLTIDGNKDNQGNYGHFAVYLRYVEDSIFERIEMKNIKGRSGDTSAGKGVDASYCTKLLFAGCRWIGHDPTFGRTSIILSYCTNVIVESLNSHMGGAAFFTGTTNSIFVNNNFENTHTTSIAVYRGAHGNVVSGNTIEGDATGGSQGIYCGHGDYPEMPCTRNVIIGNTILNVVTGLSIGPNSKWNMLADNIIDCRAVGASRGINIKGIYNIISNNIIIDPATVGIGADGDAEYSAQYNLFSENLLYDCAVAIHIPYGSYNSFIGNKLAGSTGTAIMIGVGSYNKFYNNILTGAVTDNGSYNEYKYNIGYFTENSGTATGTSPIIVPHGLAEAPTVVVLGVQGTTVYSTSWTADDTNIYIYHNAPGSITVTWYAEL